ncbi:MAG: methionyl-tRNA formyltransferase [Breznakibacter sp.]
MDGKLRIVFMGTPDFAVESLKALVQKHYNIVGIITAPDKPAGRGQKLQPPAVKVYAEEQGLEVLQPEKLKDSAFLEKLRSLKADLQIVVAFRMLPEVVWNMPPLGTFNLHGSLLPQYRGAAPINWAIINGDTETGVTTFFLRHEIDTGHVIKQEKITIEPSDNAGSVHDKLMVLGARLVVETVQAIVGNGVTPVPQSHFPDVVLRPAPKIFKEDCRIGWQNDAVQVHNLIRGLSPYPTAWTELELVDGDLLFVKVFESRIGPGPSIGAGVVESDGKKRFLVGCGQGNIEILSLQAAGKKRMDVGDFLRGNSIKEVVRAK